MKDLISKLRFVDFFAWYLVTFLLVIYLFAILLPEKFANNPIVTQYTTMAANLLSFIVGFFFGGVTTGKHKSAGPGQIDMQISASTETPNPPIKDDKTE